jgi:protein-disulfide isomerase
MATDDDIERVFDEAVAALAGRVPALGSQPSADRLPVLTPPLSASRDHIEGAVWAPVSLLVFGSYATPASPSLGKELEVLREAHPATLRVAWRHLPDPQTHPRAAALALAAEAAGAEGRFWSMHRELIALRHDDLEDLHGAARRAGVDFYRLLDHMRAGVGADRVVSDVESAVASRVASVPTMFINGERYNGDHAPAALSAAVQEAVCG